MMIVNGTQKIKVLVGDDSKEFGVPLMAHLKDMDMYVAMRQKDGGILLDSIKSNNFDVVIADARMAGADALTIVEESKKSLGINSPYFIIVSSYDNPQLQYQLEQTKSAMYLVKPFDFTTVGKLIYEVLRTGRGKVMDRITAPPLDMEIIVTEIIHQLGVPAHVKGYHFLRSAILVSLENPELLESVTKKLYPTVAKKFTTTQSRVERAIRHAIEIAWDRGNIDTLQDFFGYTINTQKGKPTNSEFIALIVDKIRLTYKPKLIA